MSNKATIAFMVVYGIIMHCNVYCSPTGMDHPGLRDEDEAYDEKGNSLPDLTYETDRNGIRIPSSMINNLNTLYYLPEKRTERHADSIFTQRLRGIDIADFVRDFLDSHIPSKRDGTESHADSVFTQRLRGTNIEDLVKDFLESHIPSKRDGGSSVGKDTEPPSKRHSDGIFTDSYSRYRKQMAVKKYLAAVLGKRYKQRVKNKGRRVFYL